MGACSTLGKHRRASRFNSDNLHVRILGLEVFTHACHRTTGTDTGNKNINFTIGVFPNFRTGGGLVGCRVCRVHELARNKAVRDFLGEFIGLFDSALHALGAFGQHEFCAVSLHNLAAFHAHGFGHHDDDAVATCCSDRCKTDTGVARSRFDNHGTLLELTALFCFVNHRLCNTILHGTGGVEVFELSKNLGSEAFFDMGEFEKRGVTNELVGGGIDFRHVFNPYL